METNTQFGKYEIRNKLGSGATSDVYLALDTILDRLVALKILKPALVSDQQGFARFTKEAQTAGKLFHDHIATVFDMGEESGRYFIAMQYIEGISLDQFIKKNGPLPWADVQRLIDQVGGALSYAHQQGFLHRDIKPNNIMVSEQGDFVLTDFGLTRAMLQTGMLTTTGAVLGTPAYIPPEVWNGKNATEQSDQYSLACVIDEAITGSARFSGQTPQVIITKHLIEHPDFNNYPAGIEENVKHILQKALSKTSTNRFKSIDAFIAALKSPKDFDARAYLSGIDEKKRSAAEKQALEKLKKKRRRKVRRIISLILIGVITIACGVLYLVYKDDIQAVANVLRGENQTENNTPVSVSDVEQQTEQFTSTEDSNAIIEATIPPETKADEPNPTNTNTLSATSPSTATATAEPTHTSTPTNTPTEQIAPVGEEQVPLGSGVEVKTIENEPTSLVTYFLRGDGSAIEGKNIYLYSQKQDLSGNWITDNRLDYKRTDNAGSVTFNVEPGEYIVSADFDGYNWGSAHDVEGEANVKVESGKTTQLVLRLARIRVGFVFANGNMVNGKNVYIYTQQKDTANEWVTNYRVDYKRTDNSGEVIFDVAPGNYIIGCDFDGYNWGDAKDVEGKANIPLRPGEVQQIVQELGAIVVELKDSSGNPISGDNVYIYYQEADVNNNPTVGSRIDYNRTNNTGRVSFVVTPGVYAFHHDDTTYYNIEVLEGKTTVTDGTNMTYED